MNSQVKFLFLVFFIGVIFYSCINKPSEQVQIKLVAENTYNQMLYLDNIPSENEFVEHIDSFYIKERVDELVLKLPETEEDLFRIYSKDHRIDIVLVKDKPLIELYLNYLDNGKFLFKKSNANISLHNFLEVVRGKAITARYFEASTGHSSKFADSLFLAIQMDYRNYVDSVANPAAALYIYSNVDFGTDRKSLRKFIGKLAKRFPDHKRIQDLYSRTIAYLSIFEEELEVGMNIPELILPSRNGEIISLSSFRGKYLLVNFWASWDAASVKQESITAIASSKLVGKNLSIVSVSLDPEKEVWKQYLGTTSNNWTQLLDNKVWMGSAVKAFKFDSIPFNFLVDPSGKIIGKAIYGDSLFKKLEKLVK